jgi:Homeodomain-like domain
MSWKKLLESVSASLNDYLRLRNDYLMAENRILRHQMNGRVQLTDNERQELAALGAKLGKQALQEIATLAKPETILAWNRKFAGQQATTSQPPTCVGRPRVDPEIEAVVIRMARENRAWGYDRIQGALKNLGYRISDQTVGNILKRHGISPAPERTKTVTWWEFVRIHLDVLRATDFLTSEVWSWCGLVISLLRFFLSFGRCKGNVPVRMTQLRHLLIGWIQSRPHQVKVRLQQWTYLVEELVWLRSIRCDDRVRRASPHEVIRHDHQGPLFQSKGKAVFLRTTHPHPIRDGPMRCQRWRVGRLDDDDQEAA